jgi:hypothetical protein
MNEVLSNLLKRIGRLITLLVPGVLIYFGLPETLSILYKTSHFLTPPPPIISDVLAPYSEEPHDNKWFGLVSIVVLCLVAFTYIVMATTRWHKRVWPRWLLGVLLFFSILLPVLYYYCEGVWTCEWQGQRFVTGWSLTEHGKAYISKYKALHKDNPSCDKILADHPGDAEAVWNSVSTNTAKSALGALYLLCVAAFAVTLIGLGHSLYVVVSGSHDSH